jgi:hypothetical protein
VVDERGHRVRILRLRASKRPPNLGDRTLVRRAECPQRGPNLPANGGVRRAEVRTGVRTTRAGTSEPESPPWMRVKTGRSGSSSNTHSAAGFRSSMHLRTRPRAPCGTLGLASRRFARASP